MPRADLEAACQGIMHKNEQQEAKEKGCLVQGKMIFLGALTGQWIRGWTLTNFNNA